MDRRTFLEVAAIATIGVPALTGAKKEIRWIPFKEQMPEFTINAEIKDQTGKTRKGYLCGHYMDRYYFKYVATEKEEKWAKDGSVIVYVNVDYWSWRYA